MENQIYHFGKHKRYVSKAEDYIVTPALTLIATALIGWGACDIHNSPIPNQSPLESQARIVETQPSQATSRPSSNPHIPPKPILKEKARNSFCVSD